MITSLVHAASAVDTVPIATTNAYMVLLFMVASIPLVIAVALTVWGFTDKKKNPLFLSVPFYVASIILVIVGVGQAGSPENHKTVKEVESAFSISFTKGYDLELSTDEKQRASTINDVFTADGEWYSKGALVSRNGEVAVYVYEEGAQEPVALEFFSDTNELAGDPSVETVPVEMSHHVTGGTYFVIVLLVASLIFLLFGLKQRKNAPADNVGNADNEEDDETTSVSSDQYIYFTFAFMLFIFPAFMLFMNPSTVVPTWNSTPDYSKTIETLKDSYGVNFYPGGVEEDVERFMDEEPYAVTVTSISSPTGLSYPQGTIVSKNGELSMYGYEEGSTEPIPLPLGGDEGFFPAP